VHWHALLLACRGSIGQKNRIAKDARCVRNAYIQTASVVQGKWSTAIFDRSASKT